MKLITKEVRIGIAGVAALCLLVFGINYLKGINMFKPASYFYPDFFCNEFHVLLFSLFIYFFFS